MRCKQCGREFRPFSTTIREDGTINVAGKEFCSFQCCQAWTEAHEGWSEGHQNHVTHAARPFKVPRPKKRKPPSVDPKEWETILKSCEKYFYRHDMGRVAIGRMFGLSSAMVSLILARKWKPRVKDSGCYMKFKDFYDSGRYRK